MWRLTQKGHEGRFWSDGNVLCLDKCLHFSGITCQNPPMGAFKICAFHCTKFYLKIKNILNVG